MPGSKQCTTCNKGGFIMLCDRCQQTFCDKHINDHRQQSPHQLDNILQEHDLIQDELKHSSTKHSLFKSIDQWEKESIVKIQTTAEKTRNELRQMIEEAKERLASACREVVENLQAAREARQFCENDLHRSMQHLQQLKTKIASPLSVELIENKNSVIHLIGVKGTDFLHKVLEQTKTYSVTKRLPLTTPGIQEKFSKAIGPAVISEEGFLVRHHGQSSTFAYILGEQLYSKGQHTIRFKIEQSQVPYNIFFGCISSQVNSTQIHHDSPWVAGWFGYNEVHHHGTTEKNVQMHGYDSDKIETYDVLSLILNCDQRQIELYPERLKKIHELAINIDEAPLPWQLIVILTYKNDSVRILHNA
ncbi:unnamed protein product [Adineta ricciae]|uniref:B box-type domain-containing protein n=1 Tax=Adineta ricciae TaxID=249248 RepID=A0A815SU38_ADIRI|nr:unnamed protein product [Adineta ricciae]CAF1497462.1 unnamed protein product [Adineta ricciae]